MPRIEVNGARLFYTLSGKADAPVLMMSNSLGTTLEMWQPQLAALESRFHLKEAIVIDSDGEEERIVRDLGAAAAFYVETTLKPEMVIGISSWSRSLFAMVDTLHPGTAGAGGKVVQILGGVGNASTQYQAILLAQRLAGLIGASPILLQAPGIVGSSQAKAVLVKDAAVQQASRLFSKLDLALVGIGSLEPSSLLASSGNTFSVEERRQLGRSGGVGDICFQFIDKDGRLIASPLMERVIGIDLVTLKSTPRVVGIAGGESKVPAILASLKGKWVNVLVTDRRTAERLISA